MSILMCVIVDLFAEMEMESQESSYEKFTWKIENFSHLNKAKNIYSEPFILGGYPWMICLYQWGTGVEDYLSIYLYAVYTANMSQGWSRDVQLKLLVFNQVDASKTLAKESNYKFDASKDYLGFGFMTLSELLDPERGFIVKDACIVGVEVYVCKSTHEKPIIQAANLTASPGPELEEGQGQNVGELLDFKGVGQIEKAFIPLLEEVCSQHPSLILCQEKKSRRFREWAFSALGRVLYFLKTRKVRDMNDLACKNLQIFWEELQPFNFNLTWLEPCVQSALGKKSYLEKLKEAEKLRDNVVALELELERLMAKISTVEINLDAARDLLEAEDFEEVDLDAELGFVKNL